jgi:hypothetical protein
MTIFHVLKYPLSNPVMFSEFTNLPSVVRHGWIRQRNKYNNIEHPTERATLQRLLLEYEGDDDEPI